MEEPVLEEQADEGNDATREQGVAMNVDNATSRQATTTPTSLIPDVQNFLSL